MKHNVTKIRKMMISVSSWWEASWTSVWDLILCSSCEAPHSSKQVCFKGMLDEFPTFESSYDVQISFFDLSRWLESWQVAMRSSVYWGSSPPKIDVMQITSSTWASSFFWKIVVHDTGDLSLELLRFIVWTIIVDMKLGDVAKKMRATKRKNAILPVIFQPGWFLWLQLSHIVFLCLSLLFSMYVWTKRHSQVNDSQPQQSTATHPESQARHPEVSEPSTFTTSNSRARERESLPQTYENKESVIHQTSLSNRQSLIHEQADQLRKQPKGQMTYLELQEKWEREKREEKRINVSSYEACPNNYQQSCCDSNLSRS